MQSFGGKTGVVLIDQQDSTRPVDYGLGCELLGYALTDVEFGLDRLEFGGNFHQPQRIDLSRADLLEEHAPVRR